MKSKRVKTTGVRRRRLPKPRAATHHGAIFNAYLDVSLISWIDDQAHAVGLSRSAWLRQTFTLMREGMGAMQRSGPLLDEINSVIEQSVQRAIDARADLDRREAQLQQLGKRRR